MSISFYDISVSSYLQTLDGMQQILAQGRSHAEANNENVDDYVGLKLHSTMLPLLFQVKSMELHSLGCLQAIEKGVFTPPTSTEPRDYAGLQQWIVDTRDALAAMKEEDVNALQDKDLLFKMGETEIPFTATNFVTSFSMPNIQFHAATAYNILRHHGVPLTKRNFLGSLKVGV